jgi:serine protease Do
MAEAPESALGLAVQELTPDLSRSLGLVGVQGVVVAGVEDGGPASEVGMRPEDVIVEVNQQRVMNLQEYRTALAHLGDAKSVLFLVRRGENTVYVALQPGE